MEILEFYDFFLLNVYLFNLLIKVKIVNNKIYGSQQHLYIFQYIINNLERKKKYLNPYDNNNWRIHVQK